MAKTGATGAITKFPIPTILVFLLLTVYFVTQSGFSMARSLDDDPENPALNVNGTWKSTCQMGVKVVELIGKVEEDWSTNVMVVYIESNKNNITDQRILQEISYVETFSIRTSLMILTTSSTFSPLNRAKRSGIPVHRIREAIITEVGELGMFKHPTEDCPSRNLLKI